MTDSEIVETKGDFKVIRYEDFYELHHNDKMISYRTVKVGYSTLDEWLRSIYRDCTWRCDEIVSKIHSLQKDWSENRELQALISLTLTGKI